MDGHLEVRRGAGKRFVLMVERNAVIEAFRQQRLDMRADGRPDRRTQCVDVCRVGPTLGRLGKEVNAVPLSAERRVEPYRIRRRMAGDQTSAATPCPLGGHCQIR